VTARRLEVLQWYALLGGALAWTVEHVLGYFVSAGACTAQVRSWSVDGHLWITLISAAAFVAIAAAQAAAYIVYRRTAGTEHDAPGPAGRLWFFGIAALVGNVLFLVLVLLDWVGTVGHTACTGS
jgi:predicted membrane protein